MYSYKPIYQGSPIEETEKVLDRAGQVYDKNLEQSDLIDTVISQMKVPKGGEPYREMVRGKLKNILGTVANDVAGGKRWDLATPQIHQLAKTVTNDQNLTFLQEQRKKIDENEKIATELRAKGQPPIYFGENEDSYQPFDKEGNQVKFKGWYEPKGDWNEQLTSMLGTIKPDEWDQLSRSEEFPGYLNDKTFASNVKKIEDNIKGTVQDFVVGTATGGQMLRKFMQEGYSREDAITQIAKYARNVGNRLKVSKVDNNLSVDQFGLVQARQAGKSQGSDIGNIFGEADGTIEQDGPVLESPFKKHMFDNNKNLKAKVDTPGSNRTGIYSRGAQGEYGVPTNNSSGQRATTEERKLIDKLKREYPEAYANKADKDIADDYERSLKELGAVVTLRSSIKHPDVKDNVSKLADLQSQLGRAEGYVLGSNPKDTKTLKAQLEKDGDFTVDKDIKFRATGFNLQGTSVQRRSHDGGIIGTAIDSKGRTKEVVLPLDKDAQRHFSTISNTIREVSTIKDFGPANSTKGTGKPVDDTSGLVVQKFMKKAAPYTDISSLSGVHFGFIPKRTGEASSGQLQQDINLKLAYKKGKDWIEVKPGDPVYENLNSIRDKQGRPVLKLGDWNLAELREATLDSFHNDSLIQNSFKVPSKKYDDGEEN